MIQRLTTDQPVVVMDTSAVLDYAIGCVRGNSGFPHRFKNSVKSCVGPAAQLVFHPITLAELASNRHEEVLQSRPRYSRPLAASELQLQANANRLALLALSGSLSKSGPVDLEAYPLVPSHAEWMIAVRQRADPRNLRCTRKSGVVPVTAMADHLILSTACALDDRGYSALLASGDQEQLGAAQRFGIRTLYTKDLETTRDFAWKDCNQDQSCVRGCEDGVAACDVMFK